MATNQRVGAACEDAAAAYLIGKGYAILARNHRRPRGELDLVARDGDALVFVEVKARRTGAFGSGREAVGPRKQARMMTLANDYAAGLPAAPLRFDVIEVSWHDGQPRLVHLVAAFP